MKKCAIILAVTAALVSLAALAAPAQAEEGVTVSRFTVSVPFFNPCTNENVDMSGTALAVVDTTPEDNHRLTFHSVDMALKGVGETTGIRYVEVFAITISVQGTEDTADGGAFRRDECDSFT